MKKYYLGEPVNIHTKSLINIIQDNNMGIARSILPQNNVNFPLPFFNGNYPIIILDNID